jgi:hypothetical protein
MRILFFVAVLISSEFAGAQTAAGKTMIAKGSVAAEQNSQERKLKRRSPIYDNEKVTTGDNSKAQLRMTDGGMIALKENSELVIADYQYADETGRGSVAMELLKGGLRSVTGAIKAEQGDYNLKTPVGSIGIRGTHYEVEIVDGDMFLAVWDGAIDVTVEVNGGEEIVSFGEGEDFSFGVVSSDGEVTELLQAPDNFQEGHSSDDDGEEQEEESTEVVEQTEENTQQQDTQQQTEQETSEETTNETEEEPSVEEIAEGDSIIANEGSEEPEEQNEPLEEFNEDLGTEVGQEVAEDIDQEFQQEEQDESFLATDGLNNIGAVSIEELIADRQGSVSYGSEVLAEASVGEVNNFSMGMTIDFESGTVPTGQMTFEDDGGEWFVAFSGIISTANLDLDVTFASHGNNLADGDISATFFDGLDSIVGEFDLYEIANPDVKVKGSFIIK